MVFCQEIIYQKNKVWGICSKSWWIWRYWYTLDCFILWKKWNCLFDIFGVEHIPEEIKEFIGTKNIKANIFRVQANNSVMRGYFCIGFIDFMLADKKLTDFTNFFSPYNFDRNDQIILFYFKDAWNR